MMRSLGVLVATTVRTAASLVAGLLFLSCAGPAATPGDPSHPLRFGVFRADANGTEADLALHHRPIAAFLEAALNRPITLVVSNDAGLVLSEFEAGRLDVVFNRSVAFPHAQETVGAIPLVTRLEDRHATTIFLAAADDSRESLDDFRGTRLAFSLRLGSSYVMGRRYLEEHHILAETFFREVHFATVADDAVRRVVDGLADLGVVSSQALTRMLTSGVVHSSDVKIIAETPPHVGQLWFVSNQVPPEVRTEVRDAFLALSTENPDHRQVLELLGASGYLPVIAEDYRELTSLMQEMQLLDFEGRELP